MENTDNKWLNDIHDRMGGYTETPPTAVWDGISRSLEGHDTAVVPKKSGKKVWRYAAEIAVALVSVSLAYFIMPYDSHNEDQEVETPIDKGTGNVTLTNDHPGQMGGGNIIDSVSHAPKLIMASEMSLQENHIAMVHTPADSLLFTISEKSSSETCVEVVDSLTIKQTENTQFAIASDSREGNENDAKNQRVTPRQLSGTSRLAVAVYSHSAIGGSVANEYIQVATPSGMHRAPIRNVVGEKWHPSIPVSIGLSARYSLSRKLAIESGVEYTYLRQQRDFYFSDGTIIEDKNIASYIGVPLKVSYKMIDSGKVQLYASAGGKAQWMVSSVNNLSSNSGPVVDAINRDRKRDQYSVNVSVGAQYALNKYIGIYAEPGLGYYFRQKSSRPAVYDDYPYVFECSMGLRFNF